MAKHILEKGERPVFVWSVGYQGIILEAYLTALFFKLWGVRVGVLNIAPTVYLFFATVFWGWNLKKIFGSRVAILATGATVCSTPFFYLYCARTMPNFSETLLLASCFLILCRLVLDDFEKQRMPKFYKMFLIGFTVGFAQYTFAIHSYFVISAALCVFMIFSKKIAGDNWNRLYVNCLWPANWITREAGRRTAIASIKCLSFILWITALGGVVTLFFTPEPFSFNNRMYRWNPLLMTLGPIVFIATVSIVFFMWKSFKQEGGIKSAFVVIAAGFLTGYSPALYHKFFLGGNSVKQFGISGNWTDLSRRFQYFQQFHVEIFNFESQNPIAWIVLLIYAGGILLFLSGAYKSISRFLQNPNQAWPRAAVYGIIPVVILVSFLLSKSVSDVFSTRYLVFLIPIYALMLSTTTMFFWQKGKLWRLAAIACYIFPIFTGSRTIISALQAEPTTLSCELIYRAMEKNGLKYAFADYWLAYSTVFIANENVIIEPIYSNYSPDYGPQVLAQERVAYIDHAPGRILAINGEIEIYQQRYRVEEELKLDNDISMKVLRKIQ
jgi:hypothetical protein